jgi:hypothetical protein
MSYLFRFIIRFLGYDSLAFVYLEICPWMARDSVEGGGEKVREIGGSL